jgi:hypothetical protein
MSNRTLLLLVLCLLPLGALPAAAQTVRGTLLEAGSGRPVSGTLVRLLDAQGAARAGALSDAQGRFVIAAPGPGSYRLRAEGIGYTSATTPAMRLGADETREVEVRIAEAAIALDGVGVVAARRQRCTVRPEQGLEAYAVWEEVRKALDAAAWTDQEASFTFEQMVYEDVLDARATMITQPGRRQTGRVRRPFRSVPLDDLMRDGFVQRTDSGTFYRAPDAGVLLSDAFLDHHCFRAVEPHPGEASLVGLAFEPAQRRDSGITGTLWVDRRSAELRYLEFGYPSPFPGVPSAQLGGRVEFLRLPTGEWVVRRWWIRSPRLAERTGRTATGQEVDRHVLVGLTEHGGEVLRVFGRGGQAVFSSAAPPAPQLPVQQAAALEAETAGAEPAGIAGSRITSGSVADLPAARVQRRRDPSQIVRAEIERSAASNVHELIESLRPQWLRTRGAQRLRTETVTVGREVAEAMVQVQVLVYHDGIRLGGLTALRGVSTRQAASVRFVAAREATQRWGTEASGGVILISSM